MYSFNYLGCIPFTTARLTKGARLFTILVSSLSMTLNTLAESMEPLQRSLLVSLVVVNGRHTLFESIYNIERDI